MYIPDICFALDKMTINPNTGMGKVIKIKALETGCYKNPSELAENQKVMTQLEVDYLNTRIGVDKPTAMAMYNASMFGWDTYLNQLESLNKIYQAVKSL